MNSKRLLKCIYSIQSTVFSYGQTMMSEVVFTGFNCVSNCTILWCAVGKLVWPL